MIKVGNIQVRNIKKIGLDISQMDGVEIDGVVVVKDGKVLNREKLNELVKSGSVTNKMGL